MIQISRLEGFYWVATTHGYAAAARAFPYPITQPGVHQQVSKLEADLGVRLFERAGRDRMVLTAAGRRLHAFCEPFFAELPRVVRSVQEGSFGGRLRIEAAPLEIRYLLPRWIQALTRQRPDIDIELIEAATPDVGRVLRGEVDLVVDHVPSAPDGVATVVVGEHRAFLVVPSGWKLRRAQLRDLASRPFVGYASGSLELSLQAKALSAAGIDPARQLSASSTEAILGFVAAGLGFSLVPWPDPKGPRVKGVAARAVGGAKARYPIVAAWRDTRDRDPLIAAALDCVP
jgi:DNA-binding transcriptional LysR family regulator